MRIHELLKPMAVAVLAASVVSIPLFAQESGARTPAPEPETAQPQASQAQPDQSEAPAQVQTFTGKIMKSQKGLVLKDDVSKVIYRLDDADKVKKYEGKMVKIMGTLDPATNMIHVTSIEAAS